MATWKIIERFPNYEVSDEGEIRRISAGQGAVAGKILKWHTCTSNGYPAIRFYSNGKQIGVCVHSIVAEAFLGKRPEKLQVRHLDGNRLNNKISNLKYGTPKENSLDKIAHGNSSKGEKNPKNKLTSNQVIQIIKMAKEVSVKQIAESFFVSTSHVYRIMNGKRWGHL